MSGYYLPRPGDHFPRTRRGHGTTHPNLRQRDGVTLRAGNVCVNESCSLKRRQENGKAVKGEAHEDVKANVEDWKIEHGHKKDAFVECLQ